MFPSERMVALLDALTAEGLQPVRLRPIYPRARMPANRVLVEAVKGSRGSLVLEPPLVVRNEDNSYTAETRVALGEG